MSDRSEEAFEKFKEKLSEIKHYPNCKESWRKISVELCACDCYDKRVFEAGFFSAVDELIPD